MRTGSERQTAPLQGIAVGVFVILTLLLFGIVAKSGEEAAARGTRVLGVLDPAIVAIQRTGRVLLLGLWGHRLLVAAAVGAIALLFGVLALVGRERRPPASVLLMIGIALAAPGEALVLSGKGALGGSLIAAGMLATFVLGLVSPLRKLGGFPDPGHLSTPDDASAGAPYPRFSLPELCGLLALTAFGLFVRAWALTELPSGFEEEPIFILNESATFRGFANYLQTELLGTGNGIFHLLTNLVFYRLFGTSYYTVRLAALFWGVVAIPLCYWLVRRLAGVWPAVLGTLLFVCAPEQLFWSRNENSFFSLVAIAALVTAHLTLWLVRDMSVPAAFATALWMPLCRLFYTPCFILFALPLLIVAQALFFRSASRHRARALVAAVGVGLALWIFSLTLLLLPVRGRWAFVHPAKVRGLPAWRGEMPAQAGPLEVANFQTRRIATNSALVVKSLADNAAYSLHWYERFHVSSKHRTDVSAGLFVLAALAAAYFAAQPSDGRTAMLLAWIAIGVLPALLSGQPHARRFALVFPALTVSAAVFVAAAARIAGASLRPAAAAAARIVIGVAIGFIAFTSLASHLLLPVHIIRQDARARFARPLFARCGTILHNLFYKDGPTLALDNLTTLLSKDSAVCFQQVTQKDWPAVALFPSCGFTDDLYLAALSPDEIARRRERPRAGRVGFLLEETFDGRLRIELLTRLYPSALVRRETSADDSAALVSIEVDGAEFGRYLTLQAGSRDALPKEILAGIPLEMGPAPAKGIAVRGGVLVPADGFYSLKLEPSCASADVLAGTTLTGARGIRPYLAGAQPIEIRLRASGACPLPLRLMLQPASSTDASGARTEARLVGPRALQVPGVLAPRLVSDPGFGTATLVEKFQEIPIDIGVDGSGVPYVLLLANDTWKLRRLGGGAGGSFEVEPKVSRERTNVSLAVMSDGSSVVAGPKDVEIRDPRGRLRRSWSLPYPEAAGDVLVLPGGDLLFCFPYRQTLAVFSQDGTPKAELRTFEGGPGKFNEPWGLALSTRGQLLVLESSSNAHSFQLEDNAWPPRYRATFHVDFRENPFGEEESRVIFDGNDRLVFPHHAQRVPLLYTASGERVMAATPEGDLATKGFEATTSFASMPDALYVADSHLKALYRVRRKTD